MKKLVLFTLLAGTISYSSHGQSAFSEFTDNPSAFTLSSDKNTLTIGGRVSFYGEDRFIKNGPAGENGSGQTNLDHNTFDIKDIDLDLQGKTASKFSYELHYSLIDIITAANTENIYVPNNPGYDNAGFKAAYIQYEGFKIKIKLGFDKLPFSQSNIQHEHETPFWSHPVLTGGDLFSRRDIGLTLNTSLLKNDMINLYAGMYSGMGENYIEYGQDESGKFEYVGRAEFCYPSKMSYNEIDEENSPILHFRVAGNIRYEDKNGPEGTALDTKYPDAVGLYDTRLLDGYRTIYGGDAIVKYRGISATFEDDIVDMRPNSQSDPLFNGTAYSVNKGVVHAGGIIADLNYNWEKIHTVFSVGYEHTTANDLQPGYMEYVNFAIAYKIRGFNSCAKVEYYIPTMEDLGNSSTLIGNDPLKWNSQIRLGYQIVF